MYTIVVGGGKVGYYLAKELLDAGNEVLVIEQDAAKCERIAEELGDIVLKGDGCEAATMEAAGFGRADMVIAVTGDDEGAHAADGEPAVTRATPPPGMR